MPIQLSGSLVITGSITTTGGITISGSILSASYSDTASFSNNFRVLGNLTASTALVTGTLTAQTLVVQTVTSSIVYSSGSNIFGSVLSDRQTFTGSVNITGSLTVNTTGTEFQVNNNGVVMGNLLTDTHSITGSLRVTGSTTLSGALTGIGATFTGDIVYNNAGNQNAIITSGAANNGRMYIYSAASADIGFQASGSSWFLNSLGIGTNSPTAKLTVIKPTHNSTLGASSVLQISDTGASGEAVGDRAEINFYTNSDSLGGNLQHATIGIIKTSTTGNETADLYFGTSTIGGSPVERMRITSGGNVLLGSTSDQVSWRAQITGNLFIRGNNSTSANSALYVDNSSGTTLLLVRNDGYLTTGTASASPYNYGTGTAANCVIDTDGALRRSTSSLKYKNHVRDYDKGLAEVLQMRPVYYKGKNDGETQFAGLIAEEVHELGLREFVQYAEDGSPDAIAYQNMIALAVKAIQELSAKVTALETK